MDVRGEPGRPWLDVARKADKWLVRSLRTTAQGGAWPADPADPKSVPTNLYSGTPGVVLFYLELFHATGDRAALETAISGADYLISTLPNEATTAPMGLYTGLAGVAFTLDLVHRASGEQRFLDSALRSVALIRDSARQAGQGVEWNESTDIISGSAGIGLFLLWAAERHQVAGLRDLAVKAGRRLVERGQPANGGLSWLIQPGMARNYPNFSHGAAGVSYFLASLHQAEKEAAFLDTARAGARYLDALMTTTPNGGRMVYHSTPGNEQIFYLSWCHGPPGTARLYHRLHALTGDGAYRERVEQLARAIEGMQVPERSPGFWNNISQCCGNAGVVEFLLDLHRARPDPRRLAFAEQITADTMRRATTDGDALKWTQAEHRVQPDLLVAQTGLMQGAAGVGLAMLHLDGAAQGRKPLVLLPDNPF